MDWIQTYVETAKEQGCYEITHENGYSVHRRFKYGEQVPITFYDEDHDKSYICYEVLQPLDNASFIYLKDKNGQIIYETICKTWMIGW